MATGVTFQPGLFAQDGATPATPGTPTDAAEAALPEPVVSKANIGDSLVVLSMTPADFDQRMSQGLEFAPALQAFPIQTASVQVNRAPVFLGEQLIPEGNYSVAFWKFSDGNWELILYQSPGVAQFSGLERHYRVPATMQADAEPALAQFQLKFVDTEDGGKAMEFGGGPIRVRAGSQAVALKEQPFSLNGNDAIATWYERQGTVPTDKPLLIGDIDLKIGTRNCPMQVYLTCDDSKMTATFRSVGRRQAEEAHSFFSTLVDAVQGGHPFLRDFEKRKLREEMKLELYQTLPDKLAFEGSVVATDQDGSMHASIVPLGRRTLLDVRVGSSQAEIVIDDSKFALNEGP